MLPPLAEVGKKIHRPGHKSVARISEGSSHAPGAFKKNILLDFMVGEYMHVKKEEKIKTVRACLRVPVFRVSKPIKILKADPEFCTIKGGVDL